MKRLLCLLLGHQYARIARLSDFSHLIGCVRCKDRWDMNTFERALVPWSIELEDFHRSMGHIAEPAYGDGD